MTSPNQAVLQCPYCKNQQPVTIPQDSCLAFHICTNCQQLIHPLPGKCCVICSYSPQLCPHSTANSA